MAISLEALLINLNIGMQGITQLSKFTFDRLEYN